MSSNNVHIHLSPYVTVLYVGTNKSSVQEPDLSFLLRFLRSFRRFVSTEMVAISDFIKPTQVFSILLDNRFLIIFGVENTHTHFDQNSNLLIEFVLFRMFSEISLCTLLEYYSIMMHEKFH